MLGFLCHHQYEDGSFIPEQLIVDECLTFLFAGQDTSASVLSWILYYISLYPETQRKLQNEIDQFLKGQYPTTKNIIELNYCNAVLKETLRIQPVVPLIDRTNAKDMVIGDNKIFKGSSLAIGIYSLHHNPELWENPDQFIPERWMDENYKTGFLWIPFSAGQRNCIGQKFATQEILIMLVMITQRFDVIQNKEKKVKPVILAVVTPKDLELKFIPRNKI